MLFKRISDFKLYLVVTFIFHFLFFYKLYFQNNFLYSGPDSVVLHYASRFFLYENLEQGIVPVWTDRLRLMYPIYFDIERGYQNFINVIFTNYLGPIQSFNLIFLLCFVAGNISLFFLLKRLYNSDLKTLLISSLLYFYNFVVLLHMQHQSFALVIYLFPAVILLTDYFLSNKKISLALLLLFIFYFLITLGSPQLIFMLIICQLGFIYFRKENLKQFILSSLILILPGFILTLPTTYYFYKLYSVSERSAIGATSQGRFELAHFASYIYPFVLGNREYYAEEISKNFARHEFVIYFSVSTLLLVLAYFSRKNSNFTSKYFLYLLIFFLIFNFSNLFPFTSFRYWVRGVIILNFGFILILNDYMKQKVTFKINKYFVISVLSVILLFLLNFLKSDFLFYFQQSLSQNIFSFLFLIMIIFLSIVILKLKPSYFYLVILLEFFYFFNQTDLKLFAPATYFNQFLNQTNNLICIVDSTSLYKKGPSFSIYSAVEPKLEVTSDPEKFSQMFDINTFFKMYLISISLSLIFIVLVRYLSL